MVAHAMQSAASLSVAAMRNFSASYEPFRAGGRCPRGSRPATVCHGRGRVGGTSQTPAREKGAAHAGITGLTGAIG